MSVTIYWDCITHHIPQKNRITNRQFLDEFLELLVEILPDVNNLLIMGDFNLHCNSDDPVVGILRDSLNSLGLSQMSQSQHIKLAT